MSSQRLQNAEAISTSADDLCYLSGNAQWTVCYSHSDNVVIQMTTTVNIKLQSQT